MGGSSELGGWDGDGEAGCGGVGDCSPGTIVWVRRRNGSWWPGRILGPDELPASQIMSPRSGTPVKLLGREDASVDWYNLEKSKRVKAFRCGEFDACIERAEASQGTPIKKREKYARREDAILHALELERKQLALKFQNQSFKADGIFSKPFADMRSEFNKFSSEYYSKNDVLKPQSKYIGHKAQLPSQSLACSQQQKYLGSTRYKSKKSKKRKEATSGPHDKTKELERHFLLTGSKRKFSESLAWEASENSISNHMDDFSVKHIQGATSANSGWRDTAIKKKRLEGGVVEESLVKKLDRRRPLVQVLQSSVKSPHPFEHDNNSGAVLIEGENDLLPAIYQARRSRCIYLRTDSGDTHSHGGITSIQITSTGDDFKTESYLQQSASLSEEHTPSDFVEKHGSDYSQREYSETETEDDAELLQSGRFPAELATCDPYPLRASHKLRHVDNDDDKAAFPTYIPQTNGLEDDDGSSELGVSQWHMKGKRNSRNAPKRHVDMTGGHLWLDKSNGFINGSLHKTKGSDPKKESMEATSQQSFGQSSYQTKELNYDSDETDSVERATSHSEVNRYYGKKYPSSLKPTRDLDRSCTSFNGSADDSFKICPLNRNAGQISHLGQKAYWAGSSFYQWNHGSCLGDVGLMFDVDLKVQASYQGEHVPLVSLMSRLNGKAIVGHPIQIEILEDGSTDHLVLRGDICLEDDTSAPPVWRTGRRTAMQRVPRSNPARATLDASDEWGLLDSEWEMKPPSKKCSSPFNHQVRLAKKSISNVQRPLSSKSQKKPYKKSSSSQKIKTLSSISVGKRHHRKGGQAKVYRRPDIFGGLIKPEAVPLVTCVPAKVVFSRILEAVGRPPLAVAHRVRMASPAVREPP